jgi:hypothetical protein
VEIKLGLPAANKLPRLAPIAGANWERGQVVTLAVSSAQSINEEWRAVPPWELNFSVEA